MNSKQFLKEGFIEDAHEAHMDHEVQMARVDCYYAAEHAIVLHRLLRNISEEQGLEGWVASKITLANDYLKSVREHLEYQMMNTDADEEDFLPLAEGLTSVKKKLSEAADSKDIQEFERGPWYIIVKGEVVPEDDGSPRKFNWLNAAKVFFRKMLDDDPTTAAQLKSEYDNATDKKSVVYYSKKLPSVSSDNSSLEESEKRPGLWANIRAKRERIKAGSGERMRKPGSKGAPTNKDLKSIRASSESMHEDGLNLDQQKSDFKNPLNLNLGSVRGLPINAGIQSTQTPQSYSNRPGATGMGLQPSLSIGNPESGPFAQISKQGGMIGYKKTFEDLGPEQKRVGQLGPTEKVKKNSGARGKLVGANESVEQGMAEGLPGSLSASDYMPGATLPHTNWNCIKCSGHKFMYSLDGKLTKDNKKGAIRVKCPDCGGSGLKKPDPGHDYFGRKKEEGVAEGSNDLYQKAIRKYAQQVANDYLNGGNEYLYGANKFDAEMFGVSQEKANKDFKTWFTMIVRSQAVRPRRGVAEGSESKISKCASLAAKYFNSEGLQRQYDIDEYIKNNAGNDPIVNKCASLAAKYFNSEGLQRQYDIDEYIKANAKQGVAEGLGKDLAKLGGMAAVGIGAGIGGSYLDSKHPKIEIGGQQAYLIKDPGWGKIPNTAMKLQGADGRTYIVWTSSGKGNRTLFATPAENVKEGVAEGLGKDLKRLATGKDVKSRAGQEIAKSQDASMKGDDKTARKHFKRYDKLDTLANKGVAEGFSDSRLVNLPGGNRNRPLPSSRPWTDEEKKKRRELDDARIRAEREKRKQQEKKQGVAASKDKSDKKS